MIKLEAVHVEMLRGIKNLTLDLGKVNFVVSGPNGAGKSGVIDAIEFGLTGRIGRLTGKGMQSISLKDHGPHVGTMKPDEAFVKLRIFIPALGKSATITRKISAPGKPKIEPGDNDIKALVAAMAQHTEMALSRRDILRFIVADPGSRSAEIQAVLKLETIDEIRSALNTARNKLDSTLTQAAAVLNSRTQSVVTHLQIPALKSLALLQAVNRRRLILGLPEIAELTADTKVDAGLEGLSKEEYFNKQSALRDIAALTGALAELPALTAADSKILLDALFKLDEDPALFAALQRRPFIERGLDLLIGAECPLCDVVWPDEKHLRDHLTAKLAKLEEAQKLQTAMLSSAGRIREQVHRLAGLLPQVQKLAGWQALADLEGLLAAWSAQLEFFGQNMGEVNGIISQKKVLLTGWQQGPKGMAEAVTLLTGKVQSLPDQTAIVDARTFLKAAQDRLGEYREACRRQRLAQSSAGAALAAYETFCRVMENELNALYEAVEQDFSRYYRLINQDDESAFKAKIKKTEGSVDLTVDFYDRGLFPPAAFHSEGHQDGMGVCLYLALMKRLLGDEFTFALLDDVVMSVDAGHRRKFCDLLKAEFPETQFVITTHDSVWAAQMKNSGLVTSKSMRVFHGWTLEYGPLVDVEAEVWEDIDASVAKGKISEAAGTLRRHLEFVSRLLADQLGASVQFRADGNYDLGGLLSGVQKRMGKLLGKAADAAQTWGKDEQQKTLLERQARLSACNGAVTVEQWAVNKAVHYNEWVNFEKNDFTPVVTAFRELLGCYRCEKCDTWLYVLDDGEPDSMCCSCGAIHFKLRNKPKVAVPGRAFPME